MAGFTDGDLFFTLPSLKTAVFTDGTDESSAFNHSIYICNGGYNSDCAAVWLKVKLTLQLDLRKDIRYMKTIIERMCSIAEKMRPEDETEGMPIANMKKATADIRALAKTLEMSDVQVVILTAIVQKTARFCVSGNELADELGLDYLKFLTYSKETEGLRKRGYIRIDKDGDIVMPREVIRELKNNRPVKPEMLSGLNTETILMRIRKILEVRDDEDCTTEEAAQYINTLMDVNPGTSIGKAWYKYARNIWEDERVFLAVMIYRYYYLDDDRIGLHDIDDYYTEDDFDSIRGRFRREDLSLQREGIIEYVGEDGMMSKEYFHIKDQVKEEILADLGGARKKVKSVEVSASRKMEASSIVRKDLFYNVAETRQVAQLKELMSAERYDEIRSKMRAKGLRTGFTCLFYGIPGTGKTETVYQIARECGRDLFIVDVSKVKSCWVGESEKNIKEVFDKYRQAVRADGRVPILLFNEADAIFGIRQEGAERAVDKMENSIQNIILQEMEDLDGILIATTNLTTNLDKAFERRFLYKIRFDKPSLEAKVSIWRNMLPELTEAEAEQLARDYDFSGGQIENIVRKKEVKAIIGLSEPGFAEIREFCDEEVIEDGALRRKIGFNIA